MDHDSSLSRYQQEWTDQTVISPLGLVAIVALGVAVLLLPRRFATVPLAIMACFVAPGQRLVILGLDFQLLRLIVLFGWFRIIVRGEFIGLAWGWIDRLMVLLGASGLIAYALLYSTIGAFVWRLGNTYDTVGMYLLLRCLIRTPPDIETLISSLMALSIPVVMAFTVEHITGLNTFSIFGGVPEVTAIRDGRLRCQGAFAHPIIAGCFWAALLPLMAVQWWRPHTSRAFVLVAVICSLAIIAMTASSTPLIAVAVCIVGGLAYPLRQRARLMLWSVILSLVALHMVMNGPVWSLLAKIDIVGGSTGYYRYALLDAAIMRFDEWWLLGTKSTSHWGPMMEDIVNEFILVGVRGGLVTLLIFVAILVVAFHRVESWLLRVGQKRYALGLAWAMGVSLICHVTNFFGVSYFGQSHVVWYALLAGIAALDGTYATQTWPACLKRASMRPQSWGLSGAKEIAHRSLLVRSAYQPVTHKTPATNPGTDAHVI